MNNNLYDNNFSLTFKLLNYIKNNNIQPTKTDFFDLDGDGFEHIYIFEKEGKEIEFTIQNSYDGIFFHYKSSSHKESFAASSVKLEENKKLIAFFKEKLEKDFEKAMLEIEDQEQKKIKEENDFLDFVLN